MSQGIYKITSPSGRIYIGQSTNLVIRLKNYVKLRCRSQVKLHRSLLKYGEKNHIFCVLEFVNDKSFLNERERYWQEFYNSASEENLNCFLVEVGNNRRVMCEETRLKFREAQLNSPNSRKGKKHSQESIDKIKLARANQIITQSHKDNISKNNKSKRLIFCTLTGIFYERMKDAAFANNITPNYLMCSLIGRNKNNKHLIYA